MFFGPSRNRFLGLSSTSSTVFTTHCVNSLVVVPVNILTPQRSLFKKESSLKDVCWPLARNPAQFQEVDKVLEFALVLVSLGGALALLGGALKGAPVILGRFRVNIVF